MAVKIPDLTAKGSAISVTDLWEISNGAGTQSYKVTGQNISDGIAAISGFIVGPASSIANQIAIFSNTTGKVIVNSPSTITNGLLATDTVNVASTTTTIGGIRFGNANFLSNFGTHNIFSGESSGNVTLTTGSAQNNAGFGYLTLNAITIASDTCAFGSNCLKLLSSAINNSGFGVGALGLCTTSGGNTAVGKGALNNLLTGSGSNIALGVSAGSGYTSNETNNITIGANGTAAESNVTRIGTNQTKCYLAGIALVAVTASNRQVVTIDTTTGQMGSDSGAMPLGSISGTTYTLALTDIGLYEVCSNAATQTITVPLNATIAFPVGTEIAFFQQGAGQVVFAAAGGVTIQSISSNLKISAQFGAATLKKTATDTWSLFGSLSA